METGTATAHRVPQAMRALENANRVRTARAGLKRRVAAGELEAAEVVLTCPWMVESMSLTELLICQVRWGRTRCRTFLKSVALPETKTLGSLTERQRMTLAALLSANARRGQPSQSFGITGSS